MNDSFFPQLDNFTFIVMAHSTVHLQPHTCIQDSQSITDKLLSRALHSSCTIWGITHTILQPLELSTIHAVLFPDMKNTQHQACENSRYYSTWGCRVAKSNTSWPSPHGRTRTMSSISRWSSSRWAIIVEFGVRWVISSSLFGYQSWNLSEKICHSNKMSFEFWTIWY